METVILTPELLAMLKEVFSKNAAISSAALFGSRAKGDARPNSDIDIAIFGVRDALQIEKIALELEELPAPYKFDIVSFESIANDQLRSHIKRAGIVIYEKKQAAF